MVCGKFHGGTCSMRVAPREVSEIAVVLGKEASGFKGGGKGRSSEQGGSN